MLMMVYLMKWQFEKELTFDGAHLNPAGYQLVLENLKVYLEE